MGKTFKRNSYRKPKAHGKTFEKKNKHNKKPKLNYNESDKPIFDSDDFVE